MAATRAYAPTSSIPTVATQTLAKIMQNPTSDNDFV